MATEDLLVRIDATTEQLRRELKRADDSVNRSTGRIDRMLGRVDNGFKRVDRAASFATKALTGYLAAFSIGAISRFASRQIDMADSIGKAAETAGISTDALQEYRFALGQLADVTDRQVDMSLQRFNRRLGLAADGGGAAKDTFRELGVTIRDANGNIRDSEDVLDDVVNALGELDSDAERAAKASEIFGEEAGPKLAAALSEGSGALNTLRQDAQDLGIVLDEDVIQNAEKIKDEFDKSQRIMSTSFMNALNEATPLLVKMADQMALIARYWSDVFTEDDAERFENLQDRVEQVDRVLAANAREIQRQEARMESFRDANNERRAREVGKEIARLEAERAKMIEERRKLVAAQEEIATGGDGGTGTDDDPDAANPVTKAKDYNRTLVRGNLLLEKRLATMNGMGELTEEQKRKSRQVLEAETAYNVTQVKNLRLLEQRMIAYDGIADKVEEEKEQAKDLNDELQNAITGWASNFSSMLTDAVMGAEDSFDRILESFARMLTEMVIQKQVVEPFLKWSFGDTTPQADGGVWSDGRQVQGYASGGVVTRPTVFPMANGIGLMGEAGPEAIMPLKRGPDGKLGVAGGGGGVALTVNIINESGEALEQSGSRQRRGPNGEQMIDVMVKSSIQRLDSQGQLDTVFRRHGARRQGAR